MRQKCKRSSCRTLSDAADASVALSFGFASMQQPPFSPDITSFGAAHRSAQPSTVFSATSFPLAFDHVTRTVRATRVATNPEDTADTRNSRSATFRQPERRRSQPERRRSDRSMPAHDELDGISTANYR